MEENLNDYIGIWKNEKLNIKLEVRPGEILLFHRFRTYHNIKISNYFYVADFIPLDGDVFKSKYALKHDQDSLFFIELENPGIVGMPNDTYYKLKRIDLDND